MYCGFARGTHEYQTIIVIEPRVGLVRRVQWPLSPEAIGAGHEFPAGFAGQIARCDLHVDLRHLLDVTGERLTGEQFQQ